MTFIKPTEEIKNVCDKIDFGIGIFLSKATTSQIGKWESEIESLILIFHCIRNLEGVIKLATNDLSLLLPARIITRSIFEAAIKSIWLTHNEDKFVNEAKWLSRIRGEEKHMNELTEKLEILGIETSSRIERINKMVDFRKEVETNLNEKGYELTNEPKLYKMTRKIGLEKFYVYYTMLCDSTHSSYNSGDLFRQNLGTKKRLTEKIELNMWSELLSIAWDLFESASEHFGKVCINESVIYSESFKNNLRLSMRKIR